MTDPASTPARPEPRKTARERQKEFFGRINPLVNFSVSRYVFSIGIFIGIVVFGLVSMRSLGVDLLPTVNIPVVNVSASYPGASPEAVDKQVTQVLESAVAQVIGATSVSSTSSSGSSRVTLQFADGTDQDAAANQVASLVASAARRLPAGTDTPSVRTFNPNASAILEFGIAGGRASLDDVYDYANNVLLPALQRVDGVANVTLAGGSTRQIQVLLNPDLLSTYGLTPAAVSSAITSSNINSSIGTITRNNTTLTYTTNSLLTSVADVASVKIDAERGLQVSDVASVRNNASTDSYTRVNGLPVVLVSIQQTAGSNAVSVVDNVKALIGATKLPSGYSVTFSNDTTAPIRASIAATEHELYITALVVAVVTMLFLGRLNTAFTVIAAIPISLAAAPILYRLMGFTFNQVSLLALIVAIGIVVDDSIVVAENVERYRALGYNRVQSVLKGASEVFSAVAAASLSLLAVLIPVSFLGGIIGSYLQQFALGLAAAVAMSWLEALLFLTVRMAYTPDAHPLGWRDMGRSLASLPARLSWGLRSVRTAWFWIAFIVVLAAIWSLTHRPLYLLGAVLLPLALGLAVYVWSAVLAFLEALTTTLSGWTNRLLALVREAYARTLDDALHFSPLVLIFAAAFLAATVVIAVPKMNFTFTPATDSGTLRASLRLPSGLSLSSTNQLLGRLENYFLSQKDVQTVQSSVSNSGASVNITLKPIEERPSINTLTREYQQGLRNLYSDQPNVRANIFSQGGFRGQGSQQSINLVSSNFDLLKERAGLAVTTLEADPNILSVSSSLDNTNLENRFVPNQNLLAGTGLSASNVASTLNNYASGTSAGSVEVGGVTYPIQVTVDPARLTDEQSLLSLPIYSSTLRSNLTVGQLGRVTQGSAPNRIERSNRIYSLSLNYQPATDTALSTNALTQQVQDDLTKAGVLDNLVSVGAADRNGGAALGNTLGTLGVQAFALSLLLVYLVMGSQFNSFRYPFYLLLPVPFAVAGALWVIALTGNSLDIFGVLGFLLLIGLSAKNAIIYLEFVVEKMQEMPFREALIEASRLRFRPIIMTTLTVLVISVPLLLNTGSGSEYGKSISLVIVGGVSVSAFMTFFVVPAAFYLFERRRAEKNQPPLPARPTAEERPLPRTEGGYAPGR
ncbi:AcrB/AcrD/AcrF family protein [Deinococcus irradiatisoli]|uniref:AcrB/AcrD/AcrF family protein n=1 Tax=Deinococcus irradiatisoli TaxID=2202254 RepID=A0A2Z3JS82_9DEIO|nr:efflux RND transporter permease subunit [Deinococcus irradiatisoli]AWN24148.1 AcrB/AcrD/AcrF family protein [Deinococcus irradiatisoli]